VIATLRAIETQTQQATLSVTTTPTGSTVTNINTGYVYCQTTPCNVLVTVPPNSVNIKISKQGYGDWTNLIYLYAGQTTNVTASLQATAVVEKATLSVTSTPSGATVTNINTGYVYCQTTPCNVQVAVPANSVNIKVSKSGYGDWTNLIYLYAGQTTNVTATLSATASTQATLSVTSTPTGATVTNIDTGFVYCTSTPCAPQISVPPNSINIKVSKTGYSDWTNLVYIYAGRTTDVTATLNATASVSTQATLSVTTTPTGAIVTNINTGYVYCQTTPCNVQVAVPPNSVNIKVSKSGYGDWTNLIYLYAGQTTNVTASLQATAVVEKATLSVTSTPSGAAVTNINSGYVYCAATPCTVELDVPPNSANIKVSKSGYSDWTNLIYLYAGQITNVSATLLAVASTEATLSVTSTPTGATVTNIDTNVVYCTATPCTARISVPPNSINIKISKQGYGDWTNLVYIYAGRTTDVTATLTATVPVSTAATLSVTSNPTGATVTNINTGYVYCQTTPCNVQVAVPPNSVNIKVSKSDYSDWTNLIYLYAGQTTNVSATLLASAPVPAPAPVPATKAPSSVSVSITSTGFTPSSFTIAAQGTILFTNNDKVTHNIKGDIIGGDTKPGVQLKVVAPAKAGAYSFYSGYYPKLIGKIQVE
jgi:plastocyanin